MLNHFEILIKSLIEGEDNSHQSKPQGIHWNDANSTVNVPVRQDNLPLFDQGKVVEEIEYEPYQAIGAKVTDFHREKMRQNANKWW